ncbi:hypothetical protein [Caproicibacter sp. BJN0012]|uniref:hypothetical protein n=1 Tax=Caproicibacter sp. BJN0012 TaxID=3110227 RepID=UPI002E143E93
MNKEQFQEALDKAHGVILPVEKAAHSIKVGGVSFCVIDRFCGWETIVPKLGELMIEDMEQTNERKNENLG